MSQAALLSERKTACCEPGLEDTCVFLSSSRRAGRNPDTATARDIWEEIRKLREDFSGDPVVKSLPSNAGDMRLISGQGTKIPHTAGH